ncbi:hypothetical protein TNCV_1696331 [Trichonephila clavipes]|nr:hypothetical protein TNCV_1696331 [Trichonephila clavipes]
MLGRPLLLELLCSAVFHPFLSASSNDIIFPSHISSYPVALQRHFNRLVVLSTSDLLRPHPLFSEHSFPSALTLPVMVREKGCGSPVVKVSDRWQAMMSSSSPVPLKNGHVWGCYAR